MCAWISRLRFAMLEMTRKAVSKRLTGFCCINAYVKK